GHGHPPSHPLNRCKRHAEYAAAIMLPTAAEATAIPGAPIVDALGALALDGAWGVHARDYLGRGRQLLFAQHLAGASGRAIVAQWTGVVDRVVEALYAAARASYADRYTVLD